MTLLSGDGGTGKTLLALQIGMAAALDCPAWGDVKPAAGRCLYIGAEDEADEFHRRMAAVLAGYRRSFADLMDFRLISLAERDALLMTEAKGKIVDTPLLGQVIAEVTSFRPTLIVLDTSVDLFGGDEIKRGQVKQFVGTFHRLAIKLDCAVLLLAHPSVEGIKSGTGLSGSTAWNGAVRSRLYLTAPDDKDGDSDTRLLTVKKANYGPKGDGIRLRWQDGLFVPDDGKASAAVGLMNKHHDEAFLKLLSALNRTGQRVGATKGTNYAPAVLSEMPDAKGHSRKAIEAAMQRLLACGAIRVIWEGPKSKRRQRLIVAAEEFGPAQVAE